MDIKDNILFSKGERNALLAVALVIIVWQIYLLYYKHNYTEESEKLTITEVIEKELPTLPEKEKQKVISSIKDNAKQTRSKSKSNKTIKAQAVEIEYFEFDPNTLDSLSWLKLGVKSYAIKNINKYLNTGARFYQCEDIRKVYGLDSMTYQNILPYCSIAHEKKPKPIKKSKKVVESKDININLADTTALKRLYGVGSKLASRIVKYRNALGGFHSSDQIFEVWGIDSLMISKNQNISCSGSIKQLNINTLTSKQLWKHPYLRKQKLSQHIYNYRKQHGPYSTIDDLLKIKTIDSNTLNKIKPYIKI